MKEERGGHSGEAKASGLVIATLPRPSPSHRGGGGCRRWLGGIYSGVLRAKWPPYARVSWGLVRMLSSGLSQPLCCCEHPAPRSGGLGWPCCLVPCSVPWNVRASRRHWLSIPFPAPENHRQGPRGLRGPNSLEPGSLSPWKPGSKGRIGQLQKKREGTLSTAGGREGRKSSWPDSGRGAQPLPPPWSGPSLLCRISLDLLLWLLFLP